MRTAFLAVAAALLLFPAGAPAAPFAIGAGHAPGLAVDSAGTAYIAWRSAGAGSTTLHFCRLPRGATACQGQGTIPAVGTSLSRPAVLVSGAAVRVIQFRYSMPSGSFGQVLMFTSTDGGNTFGPGVSIGENEFVEAVLGPGDTLSTVTSAVTGGGYLQNLPLDGSSAGGTRANLFPTGHLYSGTVGLIADGRPLAIFATASSQAAFRLYSGAGSLNDPASWGAPVDIGYADYPKLAGGPAGLFLLHGASPRGIDVRRWNGATFPSPGAQLTATAEDAQAHLSQDPGGRLHAAFPRFDVDGVHLDHAVSDDGVNWQSGTVAVQAAGQTDVRVAAAGDHVGVVAWGSTEGGAGPRIFVAPIGPGAPPPPPPPPGPEPTATPTPAPVFGRTAVVRRVSGKVRVRLPRGKRFVDLTTIDAIPFGATVDVKRGRIELAARASRTGAPQLVQLYSGQFRLTRSRSITQFTLSERLAPCRRGARAAAAAKKKPKSRRLWGSGKGKFRTRGRYAAATVRGTHWLVQDTCRGTLTRVKSGRVTVRDFKRKRTVIVRAGKRYLARP